VNSSGSECITIVGALSGDCRVDAGGVAGLIEGGVTPLTHHGPFTGKPETRIYAGRQHVLKINAGRVFPSADVARRWCALQIDREAGYRIYHPQRTWLALQLDGRWHAANVTPRLQPLHRLDFAALPPGRAVELLGAVLGCYVDFAARFNLRLDEGLSNFALDGERLIYLDDDIYRWDQFTSLAAMLGNWLRRSEYFGLDLAAWRQLGERLRALLPACSSEADDMLCAALEDQFVGEAEAMKQALIYALRPAYAPAAGLPGSELFRSNEPIGVLADAHANLPAFEAVLAALDARGIRQYLMLGDVVGYGPNPAACIELIRERGIYCLRGNHDHYVAHGGNVRVAMGMMAKRMADWTVTQLTREERIWLGDLPVRCRVGTWMAVHGAPVDKSFFNAYVYEMTSERNLDLLAESDAPVCLHGHSHIQGVYGMRGGRYLPFDDGAAIDLGRLDAALVCPGSIGQTRGGAAVAQAAIFDPVAGRVEMLSVDYDIEPLIADMRRFDFPGELIARIRDGR